jgi:dolichol kinase
MAVICLLIGIAVGYFLRGSAAVTQAQPVTTAAVPNVSGPIGMGGMGQQQPTPDQLKKMADTQAAQLLARLNSEPNNAQLLSEVGNIVDLMYKWDASNYVYIAQNGYTAVGEKSVLIVFYPFYPWLIRLFAAVIPNMHLSAVLVSLLSFGGAAVFLDKLVLLDGEPAESDRALKYLFISPFSFFFAAPFTESTFLLFCTAVFYCVRTHRWEWAGLIGAMAALTRNQGLVLLAPACVEVILCWRQEHIRQKSVFFQGLTARMLWLLLIPLGSACYLFINYWITGNPLQFLIHQKEHWHQSFGLFFENLRMHAEYGLVFDQNSFVIWWPQIIGFFLAMGLTIYMGLKKMHATYAVYALCYIIISFSPTWLLSGSRYLLCALPIYPAMALLIGCAIAGEDRWIRTGARVAGTIAALAAVAIGLILVRVWNLPTPGDIASKLTSNPEVYTLSLGHMTDLTLDSFAYLRTPLVMAGVAFLIGALGAWLLRGQKAIFALAVMMAATGVAPTTRPIQRRCATAGVACRATAFARGCRIVTARLRFAH